MPRDIVTARCPHPRHGGPDLLTCADNGVTDAADHAREQADRWTRIACRIGRRPDARGYRLAVSRAGIWTLRARRAEALAAHQLVTRAQRVRLAALEAEAIRYEAQQAPTIDWRSDLALVAK